MAAPVHQIGVGGPNQMPQMPQVPHPQHVQVPVGVGQGHPQQVHPQQNQSAGPPQPQQPHIDNNTDPIARFKSLLPRLKESLVTLFSIGGHLFYQNASQDETGIQIDNVKGRFEKSLEEFYAISDQIEISLRLAQEILLQEKDSSRNTPAPVLAQKMGDGQQPPEGQTYLQYLATIQGQISCAKDIRELLHDCLKNFPEHSSHP